MAGPVAMEVVDGDSVYVGLASVAVNAVANFASFAVAATSGPVAFVDFAYAVASVIAQAVVLGSNEAGYDLPWNFARDFEQAADSSEPAPAASEWGAVPCYSEAAAP